MSGEMGILANHVPVLTTLKPGVVSVFETADKKKNFFGTAINWLFTDDSMLIYCVAQYVFFFLLVGNVFDVPATVSSGTVTINKDSSVQIVAEEAVPVEDIDPTVCS